MLTNPVNPILVGRFRGAGRLRSLLRGAAPFSLGWGKSRDGLLLALDPDSYIDRIVLQSGYYEREILDAILANLPPNGVLWDVGANFGLHALTAKLLRPDSKVVAFEPAPFVLGRLMVNAQANNIDIKIFSSALGARGGYAEIAIKHTSNPGVSSLNPWSHEKYDGALSCRVDCADDLISLNGVPKPAVIKIDIEGYEIEFFKGASSLLNDATLKAIIFESDGKDMDSIRSVLEGHGFFISLINQLNRDLPNHLALRL
jgi:FkbM family methyltransferase